MPDPAYAPWPLFGEPDPPPDAILYVPMERWEAMEFDPTPEQVAAAEQIEGISYAEAQAKGRTPAVTDRMDEAAAVGLAQFEADEAAAQVTAEQQAADTGGDPPPAAPQETP